MPDEYGFDDFDERDKVNAEEKRKQFEKVRRHLIHLIENPSGRWLLKSIIEDDNPFTIEIPRGDALDMYNAGRRFVAQRLVRNITAALGYAVLDKIMEETNDC